MTRTETPWQELGACRQPGSPVAPDDFFAERAIDRKAAKKLCGSCPVRLTCLEDALNRGERWGVWGGCDEVDLRRALWSETPGTNRERVRYPRCPSCRAKTEQLQVRESAGGAPVAVACTSCQFSWEAPSSVKAMQLYLSEKQEAEKTVTPAVPIGAAPSKRRAARVPRGKLPSDRAGTLSLGSPKPVATRSLEGLQTALAASADQG